MRKIYLDNAATTPVDPQVARAMQPYFSKTYGNPSEYHLLGREARQATEEARNRVAKFLGAKSQEIIFTGSATESINLAHKGLIEAVGLVKRKPHIITSSIEHRAVLETCKRLKALGKAEVTYLPVDSSGWVEMKDLQEAIRPETILVSIMYVNNEVGTIQHIREIGGLLKRQKHKVYFHTDATQAMGFLNCNVDFLGVDLLSFTGHKIYAPKGIGALYIRQGVEIARQTDGGMQESGLRSGTENVPYIVGLGRAVEVIKKEKGRNQKILTYRNELIDLLTKIPGVRLTGHKTQRSPHIASFIVEGVEGEAMVLALSNLGIYTSSGSACTANDLSPSHVLKAMGYKDELSHGSIRFSLGRKTAKKDIELVIKVLPKVIDRLRKMAPKL